MLTRGELGVEEVQSVCDEAAEQGSPPPPPECDVVAAPESTKCGVSSTAAAAAKAAVQASALAAVQRAAEWAAKRKAKVDAVNARREEERLGKLTEQHTFRPDLAKPVSPQRRARAGLPKASAGQLACDSSLAVQPVQATMQQRSAVVVGLLQCSPVLEEVARAAEKELEVCRTSLESSSPCIGNDGSTAEPMSAAGSLSSRQHGLTSDATPSDGGPCTTASAEIAAQSISFSWFDITDELNEVPGQQQPSPVEAASETGSYVVVASSTEDLATSESTSAAATPRMVSAAILPSTSVKLCGKAVELDKAFLAPPGPASLPQPRLGSGNAWKVQTPSVGVATLAAYAAEQPAEPDAEPDQVRMHFRTCESSRVADHEDDEQDKRHERGIDRLKVRAADVAADLEARSYEIQQWLRQA